MAFQLLIAVLIPTMGFGQAKVGTTPIYFFQSIAVRAEGMGQAGVALLDDASFYFNPGALGLYAFEECISISPFIQNPEPGYLDNINLLTGHLGIRAERLLGLSNFAFGVGYFRHRLESEQFAIASTYQSWCSGVGYRGVLYAGVGFAVRKYTDDIESHESRSAWKYDIGVLLQKPLGSPLASASGKRYQPILTPSFGVSYTNFDTDLNTQDIFHIGLSLLIGVNYWEPDHQWQVIQITPAYEYDKQDYYSLRHKLGLEVGLAVALYVRAGYVDAQDANTWGFTISSRGIAKTFYIAAKNGQSNPGTLERFLAYHFNIRYSEAHNDMYVKSSHKTTSREVTISFRLFSV